MKTIFNTKTCNQAIFESDCSLEIVGIKDKDGNNIKFYDDGIGRLYLFRESLGPWLVPSGIVRASNWYDALEICRNEFCKKVEWDDIDEDSQRDLEQGGAEGYDFTSSGEIVITDYNETLDELCSTLGEFLIEVEA